MMKFHKYQGTGNDFIVFDNREGEVINAKATFVRKWCDRKFGIGADGMIFIVDHPECDFEMIYFNADGSQSFCGNGSRCAVLFAKSIGIITSKATFVAIDGMHSAEIDQNDLVHLRMKDVNLVEEDEGCFFIDTGSPHYIEYVNDIKSVDVVKKGEEIRYSSRFKEVGTNVNFVGVGEDRLLVRTYERGVEDETLSCGTGVTAVAISAAREDLGIYEVLIQTMGGTLEVSYEKTGPMSYTNISLIGPALKVFEGVINE